MNVKSLSVTLSRFKHKQEHQMEVCKKNTRLGHVSNNWPLWSPDSSFEIYTKWCEGFGTGHHGPSVHVTNAFQTLLQLFGSFAGGLPRTARSLRLPSADIPFLVLMWRFEERSGTRTNDFVYSHQLDSTPHNLLSGLSSRNETNIKGLELGGSFNNYTIELNHKKEIFC